MRLTDADALIGDVRDRYCKNCVKRKGIKNGKCRFIYEIGEAPCRACDVEDMIYELENAPTVDPVKHGHWIEVQRIHETDHTAICECSLCGDTVWVYDGQRAWNYCSNCGAKMDEVEEDES